MEDIDWGEIATQKAEDHVNACFAALEDLEGDVDLEEIDDPSCAPFCGCDVCVRRETIYAAWGTIAEATKAGFEIEYPDDDE